MVRLAQKSVRYKMSCQRERTVNMSLCSAGEKTMNTSKLAINASTRPICTHVSPAGIC